MSPLDELYQEVILDHHRSPRNHRALPDATATAVGHNPLCGDQIVVYVTLDGDRIANVAFEGAGCAISQAAASLMTVQVKGKRLAEVEHLGETFHEMITGHEISPEGQAELGKLCAFSGVAAFPLRVKCASLAWHTLKAALHGGAPVTTE
jgi:nitrogen fixation NifU-like protein